MVWSCQVNGFQCPSFPFAVVRLSLEDKQRNKMHHVQQAWSVYLNNHDQFIGKNQGVLV